MSVNAEGCPRLCPDCPLLPPGVVAELTGLGMLTEQEMRDYKYGGNGPTLWRDADENLSRTLRASFTVVESTNPSNDVGDEAQVLIETGGRSHEQVRQGFRICEAPTQPTRLAKAFGKTAICNGLPQNR